MLASSKLRDGTCHPDATAALQSGWNKASRLARGGNLMGRRSSQGGRSSRLDEAGGTELVEALCLNSVIVGSTASRRIFRLIAKTCARCETSIPSLMMVRHGPLRCDAS